MNYYIGLDIGTNSVGWAVTDDRYHLLRRKGNDLWGVHLFDEAKTAAERRQFRVGRRRLEREKARISYVKGIFAPAINAVDPGFFQRLEDSKFYLEDKTEHQPFALFADTGYTDREYFAQYPTVFHLRKDLLTSDAPHDVRLVYLAVLNMFKHRGHFLNPSLGDDAIDSLSELMDALGAATAEQFDSAFPIPEDMAELENILSDRARTATAKCAGTARLLNIEKKQKPWYEICKLISGCTGKLSTIFEYETFSEENKKFSICFRDGNYEEKESQAEEMLSEESFEILLLLKQIHDWSVLTSIMNNDGVPYEYLSEARVASYEKHKYDLRIFKNVWREYLPNQYDDMFRTMKENNYSAYVGSVNSRDAVSKEDDRTKIRRGCKPDEFYKNVEKQIKTIRGYESIESCQYILGEIARGNFLPKQLSRDNGVIPNQVHRKELKKILENASHYLPFLNENDPQYGLTATERLLQLFSFQIPYYVGPLKKDENSNAWVVRRETGKVYPWNIAERVDIPQTSENFIQNLIRRCSYLTDEKVLPKSSLLYERFMVLNELNNLRIHDEKISVELKQDIFRDLFRKNGKRVTNARLLSYLKQNAILEPDETIDALSGYDKELGGFTNTLANYHKFAEVFGVTVLSDRQMEIAEQVIFYSTVYGDSRAFLREKIDSLFADELTPAQIKRIMGYRFKDWGSLSREFLTLEGTDLKDGEIKTLIAWMWDENQNLMQLMDSSLYNYADTIKTRTMSVEKSLQEFSYEDLQDLYISAPVRRMVWQTIKVVREIESVMGEAPTRIFVEMTRSDGAEKRRTVSRKARLQALYKSCAADEKVLADDIAAHEERDFRIKKLYLYYLQKGRCMYSGEPIALENLFDDGLYDIDHIYPRHFVKDDSLENNLVLVKAELNREKTDTFPIEQEIRRKQYAFWKSLAEGGFISSEKFSRLTRSTPFSENELVGFINRQIVETGQGTKAVAEILTQVFSGGKANDRVVYVKAGNVSEFRQKFDLLKCRDVNDFHHANDAYLNIVVGNTFFTKFTRNARNFFHEKSALSPNASRTDYHMGHIFDNQVRRNGVTAWNPKEDIEVVRSVMAKNTPIVTRRSFVAQGAISDQQIVGAKKASNDKGYIPIKSSDPRLADTSKYGGFNKVSGAYFFLVEHTVKEKRIRTVETMPIYLREQYEGKEGLEAYCREVLGLNNPSVRVEKIRMGALLKVNGFPVYLTGRSGVRLAVCNAAQLCLSSRYTDYIRLISSAVENKVSDEELSNAQSRPVSKRGHKQNISRDMNLELYDLLLEKHLRGFYSRRPNPVGKNLETGREKFSQLPLSKQCYVLMQILLLSQRVNQGVDLTAIGGSKAAGSSKINKNISELRECKLILQSATGLYQEEVDLLTV